MPYLIDILKHMHIGVKFMSVCKKEIRKKKTTVLQFYENILQAFHIIYKKNM